MPDSRDQYPTMDDITINTDGVEKLLAGLNPTKASGLECIPPRVLKELAPEIAPLLTTIYNSSLQTGKVPQDWRDALVTPVLKKGRTLQGIKLSPHLPHQCSSQDLGPYPCQCHHAPPRNEQHSVSPTTWISQVPLLRDSAPGVYRRSLLIYGERHCDRCNYHGLRQSF